MHVMHILKLCIFCALSVQAVPVTLPAARHPTPGTNQLRPNTNLQRQHRVLRSTEETQKVATGPELNEPEFNEFPKNEFVMIMPRHMENISDIILKGDLMSDANNFTINFINKTEHSVNNTFVMDRQNIAGQLYVDTIEKSIKTATIIGPTDEEHDKLNEHTYKEIVKDGKVEVKFKMSWAEHEIQLSANNQNFSYLTFINLKNNETLRNIRYLQILGDIKVSSLTFEFFTKI